MSYDVVDHAIYSLGDIVTFSDLDVVPQAQGRIVSMFSEHEDLHDVQLVLMIVRRPFGEGNTPPKDYRGEGYNIYEYWDSTECVTISEHIVLDIIESTSAHKDEVDPHEFFDEFSKASLKKGIILITGFHDNESGYIYDTVDPHIILSHYQTDTDSRIWEPPVKGKLPVHQIFLGIIKEKIFDPFITPYYRSQGNHELFAYLLANFDNSRLMNALVLGKHELLKNKNMMHPSLCIPVIADLLRRYWACRDDSVASILSSVDDWTERYIEPCLKKISGASHVLVEDPAYNKKHSRAGEMSDDEEEEEEEDSGGDLDDFIEHDLRSEDEDRSNGGKSVCSDDLRKRRRLFEEDAGSSTSIEEEEEEEELSSYESDDETEEEEEEDSSSVEVVVSSKKRPRSDAICEDLTHEVSNSASKRAKEVSSSQGKKRTHSDLEEEL